jgi:hypothetical protein
MVMTTSEAYTASVVRTLGDLAADVDPDLRHRLDDGRVDRLGSGGPGRADLHPVTGQVSQERGGHRGAAAPAPMT